MKIKFKEQNTESLKDFFSNLIDKNFNKVEPYYPISSSFMHEFAHLFIEINTCLILECHFASITLTNHTLEKLLKHALVYNEVGIKNKGRFRDSEEKYKIAHNKYQQKELNYTINVCCSKGLISKEHKKYLQNEVRVQIRNGFSHSDPNKIIDPKNEKKTYMAKDMTNPDLPLSDIKLHPFLQSQIIAQLANEYAFPYYKKVVEICSHIQKVLIEKENIKFPN